MSDNPLPLQGQPSEHRHTVETAEEVRVRANATLRNTRDVNEVTHTAGERSANLPIPPNASGFESSASGGRRLRLAPPACATHTIYREAGGLGIAVYAVEVEASAEFPAEGLPARAIEYTVGITASAPEAESLGSARQAIPVTLGHGNAVSTA